jgi:hypothetical protein
MNTSKGNKINTRKGNKINTRKGNKINTRKQYIKERKMALVLS